MLSWRPMALTIIAWLLALALVAFVLWRRRRLPGPWWLRALAPFTPWAFAPALVLPFLVLCLPARGLAVGALVACAAYVAHFVRPMVPRVWAHSPKGDRRLGVLTANIYKANTRAEDLAKTIADLLPDIVALQELRPVHASALEGRLAALYPYRALQPAADFQGMGLLSRHPISQFEVRYVAPDANPTQVVRLDVHGQPLWVLNTHPRIPRPRARRVLGLRVPAAMDSLRRQADMAGVARIAGALTEDVLVVGDLNTTDQCPEYGELVPPLIDAFREAGWGPGYSFPVGVPFFGVRLPFPLFRIDHILYRGSWCAVRARTGHLPGSDHRYVLAELVHAGNPTA